MQGVKAGVAAQAHTHALSLICSIMQHVCVSDVIRQYAFIQVCCFSCRRTTWLLGVAAELSLSVCSTLSISRPAPAPLCFSYLGNPPPPPSPQVQPKKPLTSSSWVCWRCQPRLLVTGPTVRLKRCERCNRVWFSRQ